MNKKGDYIVEYYYDNFCDYLRSIKLVNDVKSMDLSDFIGLGDHYIKHWLYHGTVPKPLAAMGLFYILCDAKIEKWTNLSMFMNMLGYDLYLEENLKYRDLISDRCINPRGLGKSRGMYVGDFLSTFKLVNDFTFEEICPIFMTNRGTLQQWMKGRTSPNYLCTVGIPYCIGYSRSEVIRFVERYSQYKFRVGGKYE